MTYCPRYLDPFDPRYPDSAERFERLASERLRLMKRALARKGLERKPNARDIRRERPRFHGKY